MTQVKIGGVWKDFSNVSVNIGGVWKVVDKFSVNIGGIWKEAWVNYTPFLYSATSLPGNTNYHLLRHDIGTGAVSVVFDFLVSTYGYVLTGTQVNADGSIYLFVVHATTEYQRVMHISAAGTLIKNRILTALFRPGVVDRIEVTNYGLVFKAGVMATRISATDFTDKVINSAEWGTIDNYLNFRASLDGELIYGISSNYGTGGYELSCRNANTFAIIWKVPWDRDFNEIVFLLDGTIGVVKRRTFFLQMKIVNPVNGATISTSALTIDNPYYMSNLISTHENMVYNAYSGAAANKKMRKLDTAMLVSATSVDGGADNHVDYTIGLDGSVYVFCTVDSSSTQVLRKYTKDLSLVFRYTYPSTYTGGFSQFININKK